jgi:flagellar basal-body rod protein FlgF
MNAFEIAAIGLQQDTEKLRAISHNVANMNTLGYKRQVPVQTSFASAVDAAALEQAGVWIHADSRSGKLRATGQPLDVALGKNEFLTVSTEAGAVALTRNGSLFVDGQGRLASAGGVLLQPGGGELLVPRSAKEVRIDSAGKVFADDVLLGALAVMRVEAPEHLTALGDGVFQVRAEARAIAVNTASMRTGHLEASNVVASQEMVQLMTTARHAESMTRLLQSADDMLEKAIRKFGEL